MQFVTFVGIAANTVDISRIAIRIFISLLNYFPREDRIWILKIKLRNV